MTEVYRVGDIVKTPGGRYGVISKINRYVFEEYHQFQNIILPDKKGQLSNPVCAIKTLFNKQYVFDLAYAICDVNEITRLNDQESSSFEIHRQRLKPKTIEKFADFPVEQCKSEFELWIRPSSTHRQDLLDVKQFIKHAPRSMTEIFEFLKSKELYSLLHYEVPFRNMSPTGASCSIMTFVNIYLNTNDKSQLLLTDFHAMDNNYTSISL